MIQPERLSRRVQQLIEDVDNEVLLSTISAYEIELKRTRDTSLLYVPLDLEAAAKSFDLQWLDITSTHAGAAGRLPRLHGDPFDRLLIAQAVEERIPLVTTDALIGRYEVRTFW